MTLRHLTLATLLASACYGPDPDKVQISCTAESPACPDGQVCANGLCGVPGDLALSPPDLAAGADGGSPDLTVRSGCADGGGVSVGAGSACAGAFAKGKAASLCASGYTVCSSAAPLGPSCASLGSFFAADQPVYYIGSPDAETCGAAAFGQLLAGCGTKGRLSTAKCMGFPRVIDCLGTWTTPDGTLGQASNTDPTQGVLCCPVGMSG